MNEFFILSNRFDVVGNTVYVVLDTFFVTVFKSDNYDVALSVLKRLQANYGGCETC